MYVSSVRPVVGSHHGSYGFRAELPINCIGGTYVPYYTHISFSCGPLLIFVPQSVRGRIRSRKVKKPSGLITSYLVCFLYCRCINACAIGTYGFFFILFFHARFNLENNTYALLRLPRIRINVKRTSIASPITSKRIVIRCFRRAIFILYEPSDTDNYEMYSYAPISIYVVATRPDNRENKRPAVEFFTYNNDVLNGL